MRSVDLDVDVDDNARPREREALGRLLDPVFGMFVFALHLLIVYIAEAVACVLGLGAATGATRSSVLAVLVIVTLAAAALVIGHAVVRHRRDRHRPERRFRLATTIGCDALASVAILFQLFALTLVPVCA